MERLQKALFWTVIASETSHVFCCVLPTLISIVNLLAGMGLVSVLPADILNLHELMHDYERPVIIVSGVLLALGWFIQTLSLRIDCHDTGCVHEPCTPAKRKASLILKIATALFVFNTAVYLFIHV